MSNAVWRHAFVTLVVLSVAFRLAFGESKVPVYVQSRGEDAVTKSVVLSLREAILQSPSYKLVEDGRESPLHIDIVSVVVVAGNSSAISSVGTVITAPLEDHHLFFHKLQVVRAEKADEAGKQMLVDFGDALAAAKQDLKKRHDDPR
jgi:hypothetical protein